MASRGVAAFKHYYHRTVETTVKATRSHAPTALYERLSDGTIRRTDTQLAPMTRVIVHGDESVVNDSPPLVEISYIDQMGLERRALFNINGLQKPLTRGAGSSLMQIENPKLLVHGLRLSTHLYHYSHAHVYARLFTRANQLASSIVEGLTREPSVPIAFTDCWRTFFAQHRTTIHWPSTIPMAYKQESAKYLGELLLGYYALARDHRVFEHTDCLPTHTRAFIVPESDKCAGIDSVLVDENDAVYAISSKAGLGAKASFWANLAPALLVYDDLPSPLDAVMRICHSFALTHDTLAQHAKRIIYEYGIRDVLQLSRDKVSDSYAIYQAIMQQCLNVEIARTLYATREFLKTIDAQTYPTASVKEIVEYLPRSLTAFFSRALADRLNHSHESIALLETIIAQKQFYQVNLMTKPFYEDGEIRFRVTPTESLSLTIDGRKSAISSLEASQGTLNYLLRSKINT